MLRLYDCEQIMYFDEGYLDGVLIGLSRGLRLRMSRGGVFNRLG